ncbi:MAG: pseudouridylate synthase, partial [Lactobacillus ruminis]|nr:pseudouridylate synthase [Ligilactobacillus ruminis]
MHIKKSCFPCELNEMPNEGDRFATEFVRHFFNFFTFG